MADNQNPRAKKKPGEARPERLFRKVLENMGDVVDRKFGRTVNPKSGLSSANLIAQLKRLIDERVRNEGRGGRIAPHLIKLKLEWGTHSETPAEKLKDLEHQILAAAIDHINDQRYRTLAPIRIETEVDIFTPGISAEPGFGEFEEELRQKDEASRTGQAGVGIPVAPPEPNVTLIARVTMRAGAQDVPLVFTPGGKRLNVGRAHDNDLCLNDASVSKIHSALLMNQQGALLVADTGSTNGTFINGRRIAYGESRAIEDGDVVRFGDVEVRWRKAE